MIRDLVNEYFDTGNLPKLPKEEDPLWDPPEPQIIGQSFLALKNLAYVFENAIEAKILSVEGQGGIRGTLYAKYRPTDDSGDGEPNDDDLPEEAEDMSKSSSHLFNVFLIVGKPITFRVEVDKAVDLPKDLCKNPFVTYTLHIDRAKTF